MRIYSVTSRLGYIFAALCSVLGLVIGPVLFAGSAHAADAFAVQGVKVDATADSAVEAQTKAQNEGFRTAFQALLDRHVMRADQHRLGVIDEQTLSGMIQSFRVANEKRSATRYLATMSVNFKADQLRFWLRRFAVPLSETTAKKSMLVAVWAPKGSNAVLWDGVNPWAQMLSYREGKPGDLIPLVLPEGELEDIQGLSARQAMTMDEPALAALATKYGVDRYAVAALRMKADSAIISIFVNDPFGARRWTVNYNRDPATNGDNQAYLAAVADKLHIELDEDWKRRTLINGTAVESIQFSVPVRGLRDWEEIRDKLEHTAGVRGVVVLEMTTTAVLVELDYKGQTSQLGVSLQEHGLHLARDIGGRQVLVRTVAPGEDRGSKAYPR